MKFLLLFLLALGWSGCSTESGLSKDAQRRTFYKNRTIRTTAYCHHEDGSRNAIGGKLRSGPVFSASSDWSRYPLGTSFRVVQTGRIYVVDDYGSALVGQDTIDLYMTSMPQMHQWGVRQVEIQFLRWGSYERSLALLRPRAKAPYIRRMINALEKKV